MAYQPYQGNTGGGAGGNKNGRIAAELLAQYFLGGGTSTTKPASSTADILKLGEGPLAEDAAKSNMATSWMSRLETPKIGRRGIPRTNI
jgi:hypothetical protein